MSANQTHAYPGQRLGLPETGPGSLATFGRRLVAVFVDWFAATLVAVLLARAGHWALTPPDRSLVTLGVFGLEVALLTWLGGASFGQRLLGIGVVTLDRGPVGLGRSLVRTVLLCLAVPPLVWDRDGRGLHDRAANSAVLRVAP